ncbi:MAG: hypothetical protein R2867_16400 [Caldilineaceae bacterium]
MHNLHMVQMHLWAECVPLLNGSRQRYINLDNAASTAPLPDVVDAINRLCPTIQAYIEGVVSSPV